jgi:hypothetical protein
VTRRTARTVQDVRDAVERLKAKRADSRRRLEAVAVDKAEPTQVDLQELRAGDVLWVRHGDATVRCVFRRWAENGQLVVGPERSGGGFSDYNLRVSSGAVLGLSHDGDPGELLGRTDD